MMPLTATLPKAMAPFNGSTLLKLGLDSVLRDVPVVHVTVGYRKAMLASHAVEHGAASVINTEGHGNSWWIFHSLLKHVDEPVLVLTCDTVVDLDVGLIEREYRRLGAPPCMLVPIHPIDGVDGDYIAHDASGVVTDISRTDKTHIYASGIQILNPRRVVAIASSRPEDFQDLWHMLIEAQALKASATYPRRWTACDTVDQLRAAGQVGSPPSSPARA